MDLKLYSYLLYTTTTTYKQTTQTNIDVFLLFCVDRLMELDFHLPPTFVHQLHIQWRNGC